VLDDANVQPNIPSTCDDMHIYMSDTTNPGLIVYDAKQDTTWRLQNPAMFPSPDHGTYKVFWNRFVKTCYFLKSLTLLEPTSDTKGGLPLFGSRH
jgi:hypothetical protein